MHHPSGVLSGLQIEYLWKTKNLFYNPPGNSGHQILYYCLQLYMKKSQELQMCGMHEFPHLIRNHVNV